VPQLFVQADPMSEICPGKSVDLQDVVQEFDQLKSPRADLLTAWSALSRRNCPGRDGRQLPDGETT